MKTFDDFDSNFNKQEKIIKVIKEFPKSNKKYLIMCGETGIGKTHLAKSIIPIYGSYICDNTLQKMMNCQYVECDSLYFVFMNYFYPNINSEAGHKYNMWQIKKGKCLIIDDLGCEMKKDNEIFKVGLKELIQDCNKLIITTNYDKTMIEEEYGEKIYSRLHEDSIWLKMRGRDFRIYGGK